MIKVKINKDILETTNDIVLKISKLLRIEPSLIILEFILRGHILYKVKTKYTKIGIISKVFDTLIFIKE